MGYRSSSSCSWPISSSLYKPLTTTTTTRGNSLPVGMAFFGWLAGAPLEKFRTSARFLSVYNPATKSREVHLPPLKKAYVYILPSIPRRRLVLLPFCIHRHKKKKKKKMPSISCPPCVAGNNGPARAQVTRFLSPSLFLFC